MALVADGAGPADFFSVLSNCSLPLVAADGERLTVSMGREEGGSCAITTKLSPASRAT